MSHLKEYTAQVFAWEKKFGNKRGGHRKLDLVKAKVRKSCAKCSKLRKRMHRHHKGHEYLFACLNEEDYAPRYIEFNSEDVVVLCGRCHKAIHRRYDMTIAKLNLEVLLNWREVDAVPKEVLEPVRLELIEICNEWLTRRSLLRGSKKTSASGAGKESGRGRKQAGG